MFTQSTTIFASHSIPIRFSRPSCQPLLTKFQRLTSRMLCAGHHVTGVDACPGDSGGPLECKFGDSWAIVGIVSWGTGIQNIPSSNRTTMKQKLTDFLQPVNLVVLLVFIQTSTIFVSGSPPNCSKFHLDLHTAKLFITRSFCTDNHENPVDNFIQHVLFSPQGLYNTVFRSFQIFRIKKNFRKKVFLDLVPNWFTSFLLNKSPHQLTPTESTYRIQKKNE